MNTAMMVRYLLFAVKAFNYTYSLYLIFVLSRIPSALIILLIIFNFCAYLAVVGQNPGYIPPKDFGEYSLAEIELIDGTIIRIKPEEDEREVKIRVESANLIHNETHNDKPNIQINSNIINNSIELVNINNDSDSDSIDASDSDSDKSNSNNNDNFYSTYSQKYCITCNMFKTPNTAHCSECGYCILDKDHHCYSLNTCIGRNNMKAFMFLLFSEVLINFIDIIHINLRHRMHTDFACNGIADCFILLYRISFNTILNSFFFLPFFVLFLFLRFSYVSAIGITTRDWYLRKKPGNFSIMSVLKRMITFRSAIW
ncbi:hypothetical protein NUSPORA_01639 [Nucleospora cyclopteri]